MREKTSLLSIKQSIKWEKLVRINGVKEVREQLDPIMVFDYPCPPSFVKKTLGGPQLSASQGSSSFNSI